MLTQKIIFCLISYGFGSLLFGPLVTRLAGIKDLRKIGSGNVGATNVLRTGRKSLAVLTLIGDAAKGMVMVFLATSFFDAEFGLVCGVASVLGHNYPLWHRFKGGKGVATSLAVHVAWWPLVGGLVIVVWVLVAWLGRVSSMAGLSAFLFAPLIGGALVFFDIVPAARMELWFAAALFLAVLGFWRHRDNLRRLVRGEESRINLKKNTSNQ